MESFACASLRPRMRRSIVCRSSIPVLSARLLGAPRGCSTSLLRRSDRGPPRPSTWSTGHRMNRSRPATRQPGSTVDSPMNRRHRREGIVTTSDEVFASCDRQDEVLEWALGRTLERATLSRGGFVTLTGLPAFGWHRSKRDDDQLPRLPLPIRGHPARRVATGRHLISAADHRQSQKRSFRRMASRIGRCRCQSLALSLSPERTTPLGSYTPGRGCMRPKHWSFRRRLRSHLTHVINWIIT